MAVNKDLLVSGSWDKSLRVWNIKSGLCKKVLNLHTEGMHVFIHTYYTQGYERLSPPEVLGISVIYSKLIFCI